ncbi:hypothetical protein YC2023_098420 [Brassica napus]
MGKLTSLGSFEFCVDRANLYAEKKENRMMMTGLHTVADIYFVKCGSYVGWRYEFGFEKNQQYKEGKSILESYLNLGSASLVGNEFPIVFLSCVTKQKILISDLLECFPKTLQETNHRNLAAKPLVLLNLPFVVRLGVKVLMTSFPVGPLRSSFYVAVIRRVAADGILYGCRGKTTSSLCKLAGFSEDVRILAKRQILGSRIRVFDTMPRDDCAVTGRLSFFLLRFLPDSYRFKVRDRFSAYTTCLIRIEHLSGDRNCWTKISDFF